jgi:peptidoglycan/xylan/chitin deacetylase (PgdA/CDA1 family)
MMANRLLTAALLLGGLCGPARAQACGPQALGVSRIISVGGAPRLGLKSYPQTLDLQDHEVVLTFDDGPVATTPRVLAALAAQCAKATFFLVGRNAEARPDLVREEIAAGHTVGTHSYSHPHLQKMAPEAALAQIDKGVAATDKAAGGKEAKFFRFPYFDDSPALLDLLEKRGMPVFGADLWASDWNDMTPQQELKLLMLRLRRAGRGIILLHDIRRQTAEMIPALLAALKAENFHLVHIVPGDRPPAIRPAPAGWRSETGASMPPVGIPKQEGREAAPAMNTAPSLKPMLAPETPDPPAAQAKP